MLVSRSRLWLAFGTVALSALAVLLVYLVALRVFGVKSSAAVAAGVAAFSPTFVLFSPVLATEHLFVVLMLLAVLSVLGLEVPSRARALTVGLVLGAAILTRGEGVFYVPAVLAAIWVGRPSWPLSSRLGLTALAVAGITLVVGPWYLRNEVVIGGGTGLSSSAGHNFYFAHNPSDDYGYVPDGTPLYGLDMVEQNRRGFTLAFEYLREDPLSVLRDARRGTIELFRAPDYALFWSTRQAAYPGDPAFEEKSLRFLDLAGQIVRVGAAAALALSAAALVGFRAWPSRLKTLILPLILSSWVLRTVIYWAQPRYRYFIDVMLTLVVAVTLVALWEWRQSRAAAAPS